MQDQPTIKRVAKFSGLWYLLASICGFYGLMLIPQQLIVNGNFSLTARNMLDNEFLFMTAIGGNLMSAIVSVFFALSLSKLFSKVDKYGSKALTAFIMLQIPVSLAIEVCRVTSLLILKKEILTEADAALTWGIAETLLKIHLIGTLILQLFSGVWLFTFGWLIVKSALIPRWLALLVFIAGFSYISSSFIAMLSPLLNVQSLTVMFIFTRIVEAPLMVWLLLYGVKDHLSITIISETDRSESNQLIKANTYN